MVLIAKMFGQEKNKTSQLLNNPEKFFKPETPLRVLMQKIKLHKVFDPIIWARPT